MGKPVATYDVRIVHRDSDDKREPLTNEQVERVITEALENQLDAKGAIVVRSTRTDR